MSALGFDLGSFGSFVCTTIGGGVETIDNEYSERLTPSYVSFSNQRRFTGLAAKNQAITNMLNTVHGFKNLVGIDFDHPDAQYEMSLTPAQKYVRMQNNDIGIVVNYLNKEEIFTPVQLISMLLSHLKNVAVTKLQTVVNKIVISCPNYFTDIQRRSLIFAGNVAGLEVQAVLNDTSAVCISYGMYNLGLKGSRIVMFVDIGYSSTQVCICKFDDNKISILSSLGSNRFGGRNVDFLIAEKFARDFKEKHKLDPMNYPKAWLKLINEASNMKKKVNSVNVALPLNIECFLNDLDFSTFLSRAEVEEMCQAYVQFISRMIDDALSESGIKDVSQIHSVELVGGSSRLEFVKAFLKQKFNREPTATLNCDEAVSRGATIYSAKYSPTIKIKSFELTDLVYYNSRVVVVVNNNVTEEIALMMRGKNYPCTCLVKLEPCSQEVIHVIVQQVVNAVIRNISQYTLKLSEEQMKKEGGIVKLRIRQNESSVIYIQKAEFHYIETVNEAPEGEQQPNPDSKKQARVESLVLEKDEGPLSKALYEHYAEIESKMVAQVDYEKKRSDSKNAHEELIYMFRDKLYGEWQAYVTEDKRREFDYLLNNEEDWSYGEGENESAEIYIERYKALKKVVDQVGDLSQLWDNVVYKIGQLQAVFRHYQNIMALYQNSKDNSYSHIPLEVMQNYSELLSKIGNNIVSICKSVESASKHGPPPATEEQLEELAKELKDGCEACLSYKPPPPPLPEAEAEAVKTGADVAQ